MLSASLAAPKRRRVVLASCFTALAAAAAACTDVPPERVDDRSCPSSSPAVYAAIDVSDTGRSTALVTERLGALRTLLTDTARCNGHAKVVAFTGSSAATEVLFDGQLKPDGATRRAQLRRVPKLVDTALDEVRTRLDAVSGRLPAGGTDVVAQLGLAREFGAGQVVVWSDGIATSPVDLNRADLDAAKATSLADKVAGLPDLTGAAVTFAGVGRPAGATPPTPFVDALKAFYQRACERAHAATCAVTTDASVAGSR